MVGWISIAHRVIFLWSSLPCTFPHHQASKNTPRLEPFPELYEVHFGSEFNRQVQMTMISFKRSGGSVGREMTMSFDLGTMPGNIAQRLHGLLTESNFFDVPLVNDLRTSPDEYQYEISVVAGNSLHSVHVSDTSMPDSLRPLVEELTELAEAAAY